MARKLLTSVVAVAMLATVVPLPLLAQALTAAVVDGVVRVAAYPMAAVPHVVIVVVCSIAIGAVVAVLAVVAVAVMDCSVDCSIVVVVATVRAHAVAMAAGLPTVAPVGFTPNAPEEWYAAEEL